MKNIKELNNRRVPIVVIKDSLSKKAKTAQSSKKLEKANAILKKVGLPKEFQDSLISAKKT